MCFGFFLLDTVVIKKPLTIINGFLITTFKNKFLT